MQPDGWARPARLLVGGRAGGRRNFYPRFGRIDLAPTYPGICSKGRQEGLGSEATSSRRTSPVGSARSRCPDGGRADARTTNRGFERAGGGADCHAGLPNAFVATEGG